MRRRNSVHCEGGESLSRSSLYRGRSPIGISSNLVSAGDADAIAAATFLLNESRRRLPTRTATVFDMRLSFNVRRAHGRSTEENDHRGAGYKTHAPAA